jgi:4-hydroxybenzoyl-CoA thioesterase
VSWERAYRVRFGEIDHAGIMYYPAIFDRIHRAFEDFWADGLGHTYTQMLDHDRVGLPVVDIHAAFRSPFRLGEEIVVRIGVLRLGTKSVTFRFMLCGAGGEVRAEADIVTSVLDLDSFRARALPDRYRELLTPFLLAPP